MFGRVVPGCRLGAIAAALRAGARAALAVLLLQATVAVALAAALPEVGHAHPSGTPDHTHALLEVGGLGAPATVAATPPRPLATPRPRRPRTRPTAPRPRAGRTRLGRDPPVSGAAAGDAVPA